MKKTLKTILKKPRYDARDHSADAKKFAEKHVIKCTPDANGNGDDVFNAKKTKYIDREKERHGYDSGKDAEVYESVRDSLLAYLDESGQEISEEDLDELVEDTLNELSKKTLKSYIKKADSDTIRFIHKAEADGKNRGPDYHKFYDKAEKRFTGIEYANSKINKKPSLGHDGKWRTAKIPHGKKLTKEDVIDSFIDKFSPQSQLTNEEKLELKLENYSEGHINLLATLMNTLSESNQLELIASLNDEESINEMINFAIENDLQELSKDTLSSYVKKRSKSILDKAKSGNILTGRENIDFALDKSKHINLAKSKGGSEKEKHYPKHLERPKDDKDAASMLDWHARHHMSNKSRANSSNKNSGKYRDAMYYSKSHDRKAKMALDYLKGNIKK